MPLRLLTIITGLSQFRNIVFACQLTNYHSAPCTGNWKLKCKSQCKLQFIILTFKHSNAAENSKLLITYYYSAMFLIVIIPICICRM